MSRYSRPDTGVENLRKSLAAIVLNYNEAPLLRHTLPPLKACVDQIIVLDMDSTDDSLEVIGHILDGNDVTIRYPRRNLFDYGFSHPRNHAAAFADMDWLITIDSDELVEPAQILAWRDAPMPSLDTLHLCRRNYYDSGRFGLHDLAGILAHESHATERHVRLCRNHPNIRWEGFIHEELWNGLDNGFVDGGRVDITLHHLNAYKAIDEQSSKEGFYYYLTFQAIAHPRFRYGTNSYWFTDFPRQHYNRMQKLADEFVVASGLDPLPYERIGAILGL